MNREIAEPTVRDYPGRTSRERIEAYRDVAASSEPFAREVGRVSEIHDVPLIVDERQTGVGRSGAMWATDYFPFAFDLIAAGKALRVGATVGRSDRFPDEKNRLGSTWGDDIVSAMLGTFTLETIEEYDLLANAEMCGTQLVERVAAEGV